MSRRETGSGLPGEEEIRSVLGSELRDRHANQPDTVILHELGICCGQVRVDLALVNGLFYGYEIKSDRDSLRRLPVQVELYSKVLDHATLVVGDRHLTEAMDIVPSWWGVIRARARNEGVGLELVREGKMNPTRDARALVEFLWRDDTLALLKRRNLDRGVRTKPRRVLWDRVCAHFRVEEIAAEVRAQLKARALLPPAPSPS